MPALPTHRRKLAVILGTNEIASAVALSLHLDGHLVVMSHDPHPPVLRRSMSYHDALFDEPAVLAGVAAGRVETGVEILRLLSGPPQIVLTWMGLCDVMAISRIAVLVDARMQKRPVMPVLRYLADICVGLGPGFVVGSNCDVAVETRPARNGIVLVSGTTDAADGIPTPLGGVGRDRFVYAQAPGRWRTPFEIGRRLFRGMVVGHLGVEPVTMPMDGPLRGLVRDGTEVPGGCKLLEVDPRGRDASWTGVEPRPRRIAQAVMDALSLWAAGQRLPAIVPAADA